MQGHSHTLPYQGDPSIPEVAEYQRLQRECDFASSGHGDNEWAMDARRRFDDQRYILFALGAAV